METIGKRIADLRKNRELSQADLAKELGVSQATVSRIEALGNEVTDVRLLSKVSRVLEEPLATLLPPDLLDQIREGTSHQNLVCFCPNPFCDSNEHSVDDTGKPWVRWTSGRDYLSSQADEFNFCPRCGEDLVKECPSCGRRFDTVNVRYCITCGTELCNRPTPDECKRIKEIHASKKADASGLGDRPPGEINRQMPF